MNKLGKLILIFFVTFCVNTNAQKISLDFLKKNLWGYWKVERKFDLKGYPLSKEEQQSCNEEGIYFSRDSIICGKGCFFNEVCYSPLYNISKVNTLIYYENDTPYVKRIGIATDSIIQIYATNCESAVLDQITFIKDREILVGFDNIGYILRKQSNEFNFNFKTIKIAKAILYDSPNDMAATKVYLKKGRKVEVLKNDVTWVKIRFILPGTKLYIEKWVKAESFLL